MLARDIQMYLEGDNVLAKQAPSGLVEALETIIGSTEKHALYADLEMVRCWLEAFKCIWKEKIH